MSSCFNIDCLLFLPLMRLPFLALCPTSLIRNCYINPLLTLVESESFTISSETVRCIYWFFGINNKRVSILFSRFVRFPSHMKVRLDGPTKASFTKTNVPTLSPLKNYTKVEANLGTVSTEQYPQQ